ncbi:T9SS type A sorting domain-containing protein [uncultured Winogradskyella sp.]|uniref:T9SS type A sorting domain-containing protein n=1 Tax=uncultured Winogradskyella sp. TaxID=395353 RepID=UPI0026041390|nr:T9SS type A sorting domain-containing protein [uncultured Winogradskyella sp.]
MKNNYFLKTTVLLALVLLGFSSLSAQVRIAKLDPATNSVTLKNYGSTNVPISGYWFCNYPAYGQVSSMTSVASLDPGEEVNIASSVSFAVADGEFGLYNTNSFGSSTAMEDYMQWGSAGHQRESVAVAKGIWTAGTFIDLAAPFAYSGSGTENGADQWITFRSVRISKLDPSTNSVALKNFGSSAVDISGYWFCNFPAYGQVSAMTSTVMLNPGEEINIASSISFAVADGEFGLYNTNSFGSDTAMEDYIQWGNAGHQRESVAVNKGIWDAGTFINVAPPFEYTGNGSQDGVVYWSTLGINNFEEMGNVKLYPNPSNAVLNINVETVGANGTLEVYNILGKKVLRQEIELDQTSQIDVSGWDSGVYLVKISSDNGEETKRFVKQ